jgi:TolB-like protein
LEGSNSGRRAAARAAEGLRIAVLPFENASGDPDSEYLSDGITETLINSLSQLGRLRVLARSTVFRYKGRTQDPQQVGRELGAMAVLTGRVLQRGQTLVIGAELMDVEDGWQLWGERYKRNLADIFDVQEEIAKVIFDNSNSVPNSFWPVSTWARCMPCLEDLKRPSRSLGGRWTILETTPMRWATLDMPAGSRAAGLKLTERY